MKQVYVSIGSNVDREPNIAGGVAALRDAFGDVRLSPVYRSASAGFDGEDFYNLNAGFFTAMDLPELLAFLRDLECRWGRLPDASKFSDRTLDIDLLTWGDAQGTFAGVRLPRQELYRCHYMLKPMADIAGEEVDPLSGKPWAELWQRFKGDHGERQERLVAVDLPLLAVDAEGLKA